MDLWMSPVHRCKLPRYASPRTWPHNDDGIWAGPGRDDGDVIHGVDFVDPDWQGGALGHRQDPQMPHQSVPTVLVAAAALLDADRRVLLAQRPEGKSMAGLWEFPGGKVEAGETPEEALVRELREELDIEVCLTCLAPFTFASHRYETFHLLMPLYLCSNWEGDITPREGQKVDLGARGATVGLSDAAGRSAHDPVPEGPADVTCRDLRSRRRACAP